MAEEKKMTRHEQYYLLHREERNQERLSRYHNHPDTIAKREEKERKKAEKEKLKAAEKEAALAAKEQKLQARIQMALERKNRLAGAQTGFLVSSPPGVESLK
jgi:hypothetical protein